MEFNIRSSWCWHRDKHLLTSFYFLPKHVPHLNLISVRTATGNKTILTDFRNTALTDFPKHQVAIRNSFQMTNKFVPDQVAQSV